MNTLLPVTLELHGVRLEPLGPHHADGLRAAAEDGQLWQLRVTSVPEPHEVDAYIYKAIEQRPTRLAFAVIDSASGALLGTTSYHDIVPAIDRHDVVIAGTPNAGSAPTSTPPASCC